MTVVTHNKMRSQLTRCLIVSYYVLRAAKREHGEPGNVLSVRGICAEALAEFLKPGLKWLTILILIPIFKVVFNI